MSTYADLVTELKQAIEGWPGSPVRMASDHRSDLERIAVGATKYQLRASVAGIERNDSNFQRTAVAVTVAIHRRLVTAFAERAYTETDLQSYLALLGDHLWWRGESVGGLSSVYRVIELPSFEVSRAGNVVSLTCSVQVVLKS